MEQITINDTIAAIATPPGKGGIAIIRISGPKALDIVNNAWKGVDLLKMKPYSATFGKYYSIEDNLIDEGIATVFHAPKSFTGENVVEISLHGSTWVQKEILKDLINRGVRIATPGEFTKRAFLNGKIDLAQAEGIADLIASSSKAAHDIAVNQLRGNFSKEFNQLRERLIEFASLLELELDFSEEDVEFADREKLSKLCKNILHKINKLSASFSRGEALKNGVPVVIAGLPNAGKSSLLNLLLEDEKAIVTDIPGTTRDIIEDTKEIDGVLYRFIDTAGIRETNDLVEGIGVSRAKDALEKAFIIIWVIDLTSKLEPQILELNKFIETHQSKNIIVILNKIDKENNYPNIPLSKAFIPFSVKNREGLPSLLKILNKITVEDQKPDTDVIITNFRHYQALTSASQALTRALVALDPNYNSLVEDKSSNTDLQVSGIDNTKTNPDLSNSLKADLNPLLAESKQFSDGNFSYPVSADLIAQDIREAISHLGEITGTITNNDLLHSIFSRFCIGK